MKSLRLLLQVQARIGEQLLSSKCIHTSSCLNGRYGMRLVKLWEEPKYTTKPLKVWRTGGRIPIINIDGKVVPGRKWTARIGGGTKREWHWVDNCRMTQEDVEKNHVFHERILKIIEDDNRSGHIALVGGPYKRRWLHATTEMKVGELIKNSAVPEKIGVELKSGDAFPLKHIPVKTKICAVEKYAGKGALISRSAGAFCTVLNQQENETVLQMPSGREMLVSSNCIAVIGQISNVSHKDEPWLYAQQTRFYGIRPHSGYVTKKDGRHGRKIKFHKPPMINAVGSKTMKDQGTFTNSK